ncbi:hypothetical protein SAY86_001029 [Trapa natans]|uniref:Uncharacterized protein n=1 Tax=Trapa natans TaxID=22666 RepID=A0AAN7MFY1_TRANT|nr:hypothetical protein SAY86_001029 [Trapa natans]
MHNQTHNPTKLLHFISSEEAIFLRKTEILYYCGRIIDLVEVWFPVKLIPVVVGAVRPQEGHHEAVTGIHHQPCGVPYNVHLELLQGRPQLLELPHVVDLFHGGLPPEPARATADPAHGRLVEPLPTSLLGLQLVRRLSHYHVQLPDVGAPVSFKELTGPGVEGRPSSAALACEKPIEDGVDLRVAEREDLVSRGEDQDSDLDTAEGAELAGFLEEPRPPLGEGHLEMVLLGDLGYGDLLSTQTGLLSHPEGQNRTRGNRDQVTGCAFVQVGGSSSIPFNL